MLTTRPLLLASLSAALLVAGCAAQPAVPSPTNDPVTQAQYVQAMIAGAECVASEGWDVDAPAPDASGVYWNFAINLPEGVSEPPEELSAVVDACKIRFVDDVERAYIATLVPTEAEADAMRVEFRACLDAAGLTGLPAQPGRGEVMAVIDAQPELAEGGLECVTKHARLFLAESVVGG